MTPINSEWQYTAIYRKEGERYDFTISGRPGNWSGWYYSFDPVAEEGSLGTFDLLDDAMAAACAKDDE